MLFGIKTEIDNELYIKTDLSEYVKMENKIANIHLPEKVKPIIIDNSYLKVMYAEFNPRLIYKGDVHGTLEGWNYLESQQIDLGEASIVLAMGEISTIIAKGFWPATPSIIFPAELAFLVHFLKQKEVGNLEHQIPKIRRKIGSLKKGAIKSVNKKLKNGLSPIIAVMPLKDSFASIESELWICRELVEQNFDVIFNLHKEGPDLYLNGKSVKLEVTKKAEWLNIQEYEMWMKLAQEDPNKSIIPFYPQALLMTLSLTLADKLEKELKQGEIVVVDVSTLFEGLILLASKSLSKKSDELELKCAMDHALDLANEGRQSIVFYSCARDISTAVCVDAETIMGYVNYIKEHARPLISLRKEYPYTMIKIFSDLLKSLDKST